MPEFKLHEQYVFLADTWKWIDSLDPFTRGYLDSLFWTEQDRLEEECQAYGESLDKAYLYIPSKTRASIQEDCDAFTTTFPEFADSEQAGIDFWLTRNGHGAGFWDGHWPKLQATRYTQEAKIYGESYVYLGDPGEVCVS